MCPKFVIPARAGSRDAERPASTAARSAGRGTPLLGSVLHDPILHQLAPLYCEDNGRPNQPVLVVFGVLLMKEIFNLTDDEALEQLEFNLLWQHALGLAAEDAHLCQRATSTAARSAVRCSV